MLNELLPGPEWGPVFFCRQKQEPLRSPEQLLSMYIVSRFCLTDQ